MLRHYRRGGMVGRFDERFLEEIKSRLRPSDVIGRTVKLRKQGREYVGLSPFNMEKTPSFYVNDDKGMFFDFSSMLFALYFLFLPYDYWNALRVQPLRMKAGQWVRSRLDGEPLGELVPRIAAVADRLTIIRSLSTGSKLCLRKTTIFAYFFRLRMAVSFLDRFR